jgi:hypothetical protein
LEKKFGRHELSEKIFRGPKKRKWLFIINNVYGTQVGLPSLARVRLPTRLTFININLKGKVFQQYKLLPL